MLPEPMGLGVAAGGRLHQEIAEDEHELTDYDLKHSSRVFVHILNSEAWTKVTGLPPMPTPVDSDMYTRAGLPWFDYYLEGQAVAGSKKLASVKSLGELKPAVAKKDGKVQKVAKSVVIIGSAK